MFSELFSLRLNYVANLDCVVPKIMLEADLLTLEPAGAEGKQSAPAVADERSRPGARQ